MFGMPGDSGVFALVVVVAAVALYFLPWFIASRRGHRNRTAIGALNLLLGWTLLGWVAAFVWSLTEP